MREWLEAHVPDRAERVLSLVRQSRGGKLYRAEFGRRMTGEGPYAQMIAQRFRLACARLGLTRRTTALDCSRFRVPDRLKSAPQAQMSLF